MRFGHSLRSAVSYRLKWLTRECVSFMKRFFPWKTWRFNLNATLSSSRDVRQTTCCFPRSPPLSSPLRPARYGGGKTASRQILRKGCRLFFTELIRSFVRSFILPKFRVVCLPRRYNPLQRHLENFNSVAIAGPRRADCAPSQTLSGHVRDKSCRLGRVNSAKVKYRRVTWLRPFSCSNALLERSILVIIFVWSRV